MENVTLVIRIDAGLINVNPETVEEALNKYFAPDGAVSVFYAAQQSVHLTGLCVCPEEWSVDIHGNCSNCGLSKSPRK